MQAPDAFSKSKTNIVPIRTIATQPRITFSLEPKQKWILIEEDNPREESNKAYSLSDDENVSLKFNFEKVDQLSELNNTGLDKSIEQILAGKILLLKTIGVQQIKLIDKKIENIPNGKLLVIHIQYKSTNNLIEKIEKYYMYPNETLIISLTWLNRTNDTIKTSAIADLGNIKVEWNSTFGNEFMKAGQK